MRAMQRLALPLLFGAALVAAAAPRHDPRGDIDFGADHTDFEDKANRIVLSGNVAVRQGEMTLNAQRMTVNTTGELLGGNPQAARIDAAGDVVVTRPNQTARARYAVYDVNRRVITMVGGVRLTQGKSNINGARLTINLDTGRAVVDGSGVAGGSAGGPSAATRAPGGRVTGTFSVPKRD